MISIKSPFVLGLAASAWLGSATAMTFHGLTTTGDRLLTFDSTGAVLQEVSIQGLISNDSIVDIDLFTSGDRRLYGLGSSGTLYTINPFSGTANMNVPNAAVGSPTAIDFNPAADRLRIFSGASNFRLTPNTGVVTSDGSFAYAATDANLAATPQLAAAAYINNIDNPGATALYSLDSNTDSLLLHSGGPQFSTLNTVAALELDGAPFDLGSNVGFDIFSKGVGQNVAFVSHGNDLYQLQLASGKLTALGTVASSHSLKTIAAVPESGAEFPVLLGALGGLFLIQRRKVNA